jgi:hypothetical protein
VLAISLGLNIVASAIVTIANARAGLTLFAVGVALILFGYFFLPESAPALIPLRYDSGQSSARQNQLGQWCNADGRVMSTGDVLRAKHLINRYGLIFRVQGERAFEIAPINVRVGKSELAFDSNIPNWAEGDGEGFLPINMNLSNGSGINGGLFEEMRDQDVSDIPITVRYRDSKRRRYKTSCEIERNVHAPLGLSVTKVKHGRDLFGSLLRN